MLQSLVEGRKYEEDQMFENLTKEDSKLINAEIANEYGLTLEQTKKVLESKGATVQLFFASETNESTFREKCKEALKSTKPMILVNFQVSKVGYEWEIDVGHFSPIAAYNETEDKFLLLDVWPQEKRWWIPATNLFDSLNTFDFDSKKSRGWLFVSK